MKELSSKSRIFMILLAIFFHIVVTSVIFQFYTLSQRVYLALIYLLLIGLFFTISKRFSYLLLVVFLMGYGGVQLVLVWYYQVSFSFQSTEIIKHALSLLSATSLWLTIYLLKDQNDLMDILYGELDTYRKYDQKTLLLTANEFEYRLKPLLMSLSRRNENGFIVMTTICDDVPDFQVNTIFDFLSESWLKTVRDSYDLVGKVNTHQIVVALQNTNGEGVDIVLERLKKNIKNPDVVKNSIYQIHVIDIAEVSEDLNSKTLLYDLSSLNLFSGEISKEWTLYAK